MKLQDLVEKKSKNVKNQVISPIRNVSDKDQNQVAQAETFLIGRFFLNFYTNYDKIKQLNKEKKMGFVTC